MRRGALLAAVALAVGCSTETPQSCPGDEVGTFDFVGTLATTTLPAGLDPRPDLPDCDPALGFPRDLRPFRGTLAADASSSAGALCRSSGRHLFGTESSGRFDVETSSGGAVLDACGPTCAATSRVVVRGDVFPDVASPETFQGALVEQLAAGEGDCSACGITDETGCAARYLLSGTVVPP